MSDLATSCVLRKRKKSCHINWLLWKADVLREHKLLFCWRNFAFLGEAPGVKCKGADWGKTMEAAQGQAALQKSGSGILELVSQVEDRISLNSTWVKTLREREINLVTKHQAEAWGEVAKQKLPNPSDRNGWGGFSAMMFGSSSLSWFLYCYFMLQTQQACSKILPLAATLDQDWST